MGLLPSGQGGSAPIPPGPSPMPPAFLIPRTVELASQVLPAGGAYTAQAFSAIPAGTKRVAYWVKYTGNTATSKPKFRVEFSNGTDTGGEMILDPSSIAATSAGYASANIYVETLDAAAPGVSPAFWSGVIQVNVPDNSTGIRLLAAEYGDIVAGHAGTIADCIHGGWRSGRVTILLAPRLRTAALREPGAGYFNKFLPTGYTDLLAWYALPPKSLIASPDDYVARVVPSTLDLSAWSPVRSTTASAGVNDPDGNAVWTLIENTGATTSHYAAVTVSNAVLARTTTLVVTFRAYAGPSARNIRIQDSSGAGAIFSTSDGSVLGVSAGVTAPPATDIGGGYFLGTIVGRIANAAVSSRAHQRDRRRYTGDGTSGAIRRFRRAARPRRRNLHPLRSQSPSPGAPYLWRHGVRRDAGTFANMPYYQGSLSANWSTGAPSAYNPGNSSMKLRRAAGGSRVCIERSTVNRNRVDRDAQESMRPRLPRASALLKLAGATANVRMLRAQPGRASGADIRVDDGAGTPTAATGHRCAGRCGSGGPRTCSAAPATALYKGSAAPLIADASNPLAATAITCTLIERRKSSKRRHVGATRAGFARYDRNPSGVQRPDRGTRSQRAWSPGVGGSMNHAIFQPL